MKNWKDRKIESLEKEIRTLQDKLYRQIEEGNRLQEKIGSLRFQNSTLANSIFKLQARIAELERQLRNER